MVILWLDCWDFNYANKKLLALCIMCAFYLLITRVRVYYSTGLKNCQMLRVYHPNQLFYFKFGENQKSTMKINSIFYIKREGRAGRIKISAFHSCFFLHFVFFLFQVLCLRKILSDFHIFSWWNTFQEFMQDNSWIFIF